MIVASEGCSSPNRPGWVGPFGIVALEREADDGGLFFRLLLRGFLLGRLFMGGLLLRRRLGLAGDFATSGFFGLGPFPQCRVDGLSSSSSSSRP